MRAVDKSKRRSLAPLFQGFTWNHLPDAILDGTLGRAWVDDEEEPQVAVLEAPSLRLRILGGDAGHPAARRYVEGLPSLTALLCASEGWEPLLHQVHPGQLFAMTRYAFSSEALDPDHLRELGAQIPEGYRLERLDLPLARRLAEDKSEFASDHLRNFDSPADFVRHGFGYCLLQENEIVSVATTFVVCDTGIEIQVNTREPHRGQGLATVVAAHAVLESLQRDLHPNWDAQNEVSAHLALKLGYTARGSYSLLILGESRFMAAMGRLGLRIKRFFCR